jgi:glycosyltransferase involved in cell wall biosynthesis
MVTEFSELPTGYSVYSKELLSRLKDEFEVAELAAYVSPGDPKINNIPWQVFPNKPLEGTPEYSAYKSSAIAEFGEFTFNSVVLGYKPDFVIDIRDFWMLSYEYSSPYRSFYHWAIMPTVDARPQNMEWVEAYENADAVFTYSEFGRDTLKNQGSFNNFQDVASPCASNSFFPIKNKTELRNEFGLESAPYIVGTVMRNQRRKLYPDLFRDFRNYLSKYNREDVFLYCHTSYPDVGWDIPKLLIDNNLTHKVLFTYKCSKCGHVDCAFFSDVMKNCKKCGGFSSGICGINNPVNEKELAKIYNVFDIYVQYANSEGFGMPQLEAAQCGNVVCSVDYSAMSSVLDNIGGYAIPTKHLETEVETGCLRAIPDERNFIDLLVELTSKTKEELKNIGLEIYRNTISKYNWNKTAEKWATYIRNTPVIPYEKAWGSPIKILQPAPFNQNLTMPLDQTNFLISEVLRKPELIGSFLWRRLLKELTYKSTVENLSNFYINEHHYKDALKMKPFTYKDAYDSMVALRNFYNTWEQYRS